MAGKSTRNGQKFSDRQVIGFSSSIIKIIGVEAYVNRIDNIIYGIKVKYEGIDGKLHITDENIADDEGLLEKFKCI